MSGNGKEIIQGEVIHEAALATVRPDTSLVLAPVMNIELARKRLAEFQEFVAGYLKEGEDFGTIPGTPKPTLYKPGADKLCELYGLADTYRFAIPPIEDFKAEPPLFDYTLECSLWRGDRLVSTGMGSCNSYESKYKLRDQQRTCPLCHKAAIIKGSEQYGGGWVCWKKKDGCGAKFTDDDPKITAQPSGKIVNDDISTLKNTILKMAKKRAKIDATLSATRSSGVFTQDIEDMGAQDDSNGSGTKAAAQNVAERKKAEHATRKSSISKVSVLMGDKDGKIYGQGIAQLLQLLDQHKPKWRDQVRWDEGELCQKVTSAAALALQQFCTAHQMECEFVEKATGEVKQPVGAESVPPTTASTSGSATQKPPRPRATITGDRLFGPLDAAELKQTRQKVSQYLACQIGDYKVSLFDNKELDFGKPRGRIRVFDELLRSLRNPVEFQVVKSGQYLNAKAVLRIGCYEWEEDGTPVIRRDADDLARIEREMGDEITDEDLGI